MSDIYLFRFDHYDDDDYDDDDYDDDDDDDIHNMLLPRSRCWH